MINSLKFGEFEARISFDPDISMYRGEFIGLNGGADFYASSVEGLLREGSISLRVLLEYAEEVGVDIRKNFPAH